MTKIVFELVTWTGTPGTGSGGQAFLILLIDILFYTSQVVNLHRRDTGKYHMPSSLLFYFVF
jgi:hypothetical protein